MNVLPRNFAAVMLLYGCSVTSAIMAGPYCAAGVTVSNCGMMFGMTTQKIAITVPQETLVRARRAVKAGRAASLSAYISHAIDQRSLLDDLDLLLQEMLEASGGPLTVAEERRADAILSHSTRRKRRVGK